MKLPNLSVKRPVATTMVFVALLLFGLVSLHKLPLDLMPEMELPALTVMTVYPGASAEEVEEQITTILEEILAGTENLKEISSASRENVSFITLQFEWGADINESANNARDLMELVKRSLPEESSNPVIYKINSSLFPVIVYGISATESYNGINEIIEDKVALPIKKVEGVGSVIYIGQPVREVKINVNPDKLMAYNISIAQISSLLKTENISIPGGNIKVGDNDFSIKIPGKLTDQEEIREVAIKDFNGKIVRLKDIATLEDDFKDKDEYARSVNGKGVSLMVQKQSGVNTLEVANNVRAEVEKIQKTLPPDVEIFEIINTDELVVQSIRNLTNTLWWALLFVTLVVFVFLRQWRSSLIVFLTIPFSLIISFIVMFAIGYTINIFSLSAIVIALGMVVDNAIVVLENISQHIDRGGRAKQAAIFGASEMGMAITASTATTLMVFIPMIFVGGVVGLLFKQLAVVTSVTMLAALLTSLSLTPMISSRLLRRKDKNVPISKSNFFSFTENIFFGIEKIYKSTLKWAVNHRAFTILVAIAAFGVTMYFGRFLGTDYIPEFDAGDIMVVIETEVGTTSEKTDQVAQKVMDIVKEEVPEIIPSSLVSVTGQTEDGTLSSIGFEEGKNVATILCHMVLPDERERSAKEVGEALRQRISKIPEVEKFHVTAGSIISAAITGNVKPIEVEVSGENFDLINKFARGLTNKMMLIEGLADIQSTVDPGKLELRIKIDRKKAYAMGLNSSLIGMQVRQSIYGADAGGFSQGGEEYEMNIRYDESERNSIEDLRYLNLTNMLGQQVPLKSVAEIEEGMGAMQIEHKSQQRIVKIMANLMGVSLGEAAEDVQQIIDEMEIPEGVEVAVSGQLSQQGESFEDLYLLLIIGIALVYMVMAAQFESFKDPFIIMFAIPFTMVGIVLAFFVTGLTLSVTTFIGVIMLMGIVVNNGIVLVDYIKLLRKRGYQLKDAILEGGRSRLRPVLMTSFTTMLGMLPMAMTKGMGREMYSPLGVTIIGGLLISTFVTLILVPTIYATFHKEKKIVKP